MKILINGPQVDFYQSLSFWMFICFLIKIVTIEIANAKKVFLSFARMYYIMMS